MGNLWPKNWEPEYRACQADLDARRGELATAQTALADCTAVRTTGEAERTACVSARDECCAQAGALRQQLTACQAQSDERACRVTLVGLETGALRQRLATCCVDYLSWEVKPNPGAQPVAITKWASVQDPAVFLVATPNANTGAPYGTPGKAPTQTATGLRTNFGKLSVFPSASPTSRTVFLVFTQHVSSATYSLLLRWTDGKMLRTSVFGNTNKPSLLPSAGTGTLQVEDPYDFLQDSVQIVGVTTFDSTPTDGSSPVLEVRTIKSANTVQSTRATAPWGGPAAGPLELGTTPSSQYMQSWDFTVHELRVYARNLTGDEMVTEWAALAAKWRPAPRPP